MGLTYFDSNEGRARIKRRYLWALYGYLAGVATVALLRLMIA